ncbi:hypothetical protein V8B97DRAFT_928977 [Scleroderma yunnanense]
MTNPGEECNVEVDQIGWSQDSISDTFQDGRDVQQAINALRRLTHEERVAIVATYPPIRVVQFVDQGWITLDNRRLFLFRAVLLPGTPIRVRVATLQEAEELKRKLTTGDEGATIVVRSNRRNWR